jgi:hypothetical protein
VIQTISDRIWQTVPAKNSALRNRQWANRRAVSQRPGHSVGFARRPCVERGML